MFKLEELSLTLMITIFGFRNNPGLITVELQQNPLELVEGPFLISKSVLYLYLSDCNLSKLSPSFFSNITALNTLDLSGNQLRIVETGIFDPLVSLETLKLNRCNLTHIAGIAFNSLVHLKVLELAHNNLKHQVDWALVLGSLVRLELLDLRNSGISNLPENTFIKNPWLRTLILAENELAGLDVVTTLGHNLIHLDTLDISYCHLTEPLSEAPFLNATKLRTLILSGNRLSSAVLSTALAPLTRLQTLSLRDCGLTRLPANTFHRFAALQKLDLSYNPLNNAFTGLLSPLESLEHLDMGYSNLKSISKDTFIKMNSLRTLILSGNKLQQLEYGLFQNLTKLETLELNHCGLSRLQEAVFYDNYTYPDLEELRLAGNPLKVDLKEALIPKQLSRLKILDLRNCELSFLPSVAFNSSRNITRLLLADNRLSNVDSTALKFLEPLKHLTYLDLSNNNFSSITSNVFFRNPEIQSLKLVGNPWKCDCNVVDMWQWAQSERGDIGVLIGSTTAAADTVAINSKKKKALLCYLDTKTPIKEGKLRRPGRELLFNVNRTWARYVREADCTWNHTQKPPRILNRRTRSAIYDPLIKETHSHSSSAVVWLLAATGILTVVFGIFSLVSYRYKKARRSRTFDLTLNENTYSRRSTVVSV